MADPNKLMEHWHCKRCGEPIRRPGVEMASTYDRKGFCGPTCQSIYRYQHPDAEPPGCAWCGDEIPLQGAVAYPGIAFCSEKCSERHDLFKDFQKHREIPCKSS